LKEQNVVPTWNYVAVHATGKVKLIEEPSELLDIIRRYVEVYEAPMPEPWQLDSAEPDFIESLLGAIVGFTIEIDSLEGKWKLNQNHSEERRQKLVDGLKTRPDDGALKIAALMQATLSVGH
jgi:transcriptional regulator